MNLWTVFITGLFAGGVSCAVVQGGLLAGAVTRRRGMEAPVTRSNPAEDVLPVSGFLAGKLVSHAVLGALLGLLGDTAQLGFRARALVQILAGLLMLIMALDLLGVKGVRRLIPPVPASLGRLMRKSGKSHSALMPALLGFATVLIPCGVTLSMELLAVSSGSAMAGASIMAIFVVGTSPMFAALGYVARRSAMAFRGRLGKLAAVAVMMVGLFTINTGLVLAGSPFTFSAVREAFVQARADLVRDSEGSVTGLPPGVPTGGARVVEGVQIITINATNWSYEPSRIQAKAGLPTRVTVRTNRTRSCTRSFVIPSLGTQGILPETGETNFELGRLPKGDMSFTCSMGMYSGVIHAA